MNYGDVPHCHIDEWNFFSAVVEFKKHSVFINHYVDSFSDFNLLPLYTIIYSSLFYFFEINIFTTTIIQILIFLGITIMIISSGKISSTAYTTIGIGVTSTLTYQGMRPEALGALICLLPILTSQNKRLFLLFAPICVSVAFLVSIRSLPISLIYIHYVMEQNKDNKGKINVKCFTINIILIGLISLLSVIILYETTAGNFLDLVKIIFTASSSISHTTTDNYTFLALLQRPVGIISYGPLLILNVFLFLYACNKKYFSLVLICSIPVATHLLGSYIYYTIFLLIITNFIVINLINNKSLTKLIYFLSLTSSLPLATSAAFNFIGLTNSDVKIMNLENGIESLSTTKNLIIDAKTAKYVFDYNPPCETKILGYHNSTYPIVNYCLLPHQSSITTYTEPDSVQFSGFIFPSQKYNKNLFYYQKSEH